MHRRALVLTGLATLLAPGASPARLSSPPRNARRGPLDFFGTFQGPRPEHQYLRRFEGDWDFVAKATLPGGAVREMKGTCHSRLACSGTWLVSEARSEFQGLPYEAIGLLGYDAPAKKYVATWIDLAKGFLDPMVGEVNEEDRLVTVGPIVDPSQPSRRIQARGTFLPFGDDSFDYVEELEDGQGGWTPWLRTTYTRAN